MKTLLSAAALLLIACPASAETLNLFPNGRDAYLTRYEDNVRSLNDRATAFNDYTYRYGGEKDFGVSGITGTDEKLSENELDAFIDNSLDLDAGRDAASEDAPVDAPPLPSSAAQ